MKESPRSPRTTHPVRAIQPRLTSRTNPVQPDAISLAPEKIQEKVSTPSKILIRMLEGYDTVRYTRHWGINE
ncbi:MAG TPA: hypothetical protein VL361_01635 [Candidatus Limnocylindrales bacterium]|jgi:hypothetical protein|nr:hypothetical protein [Candidatus Limnocylindrales bacterium]